MIRAVPEHEPPPMTTDEYKAHGSRQWAEARRNMAQALSHLSSVAGLIDGQESIRWRDVKSALTEARQLRAVCDRMIVNFTVVVENGERIAREREQP